MEYDVQNFKFVSWQLRRFSQTSKCEVAVYRLTLHYLNSTRKWRLERFQFAFDPELSPAQSVWFPLHNTVKKAITVTLKSVQLVEGVKRCALGSMDIISGTTLCHKLLPAVLQWTLWFPNPSLLKAIPSYTAHIKLYHIPFPSAGRYYNCMFIFISCCLYSLVRYICSCPKFHSRFSNMKLYVFLWFLSLPFSFLLT